MSEEMAYRSGRRLEILLVEDNPGDTLLTREAFRKSGLAGHIVVAENGEQALAMLRQGQFHGRERPDVILLDLNLPRLDGSAVLARLQRDPELKKIAVVILSGLEAEEARGCKPSRQAHGHLVKPVTLQALREVAASLGGLGPPLWMLGAN